MKTLLVLRHAKSDWDADYTADHERPLNKRGLASADYVGQLVRDLDLIPDTIISSTAVRARATAELAKEAGGWSSSLTLDPDLYYSGVEYVIGRVAGVGDADRVMIVGHQPTWGSLVYRLTGVSAEIKTATLAIITFAFDDWAQLPEVTGELSAVHHPPH